jgi:hypothetical protein
MDGRDPPMRSTRVGLSRNTLCSQWLAYRYGTERCCPAASLYPPRHTAVWRVACVVARKGTLAMTRVFQWLDEAFSLLAPLA